MSQMPAQTNSGPAPVAPQAVLELIERSHRLGSDPRNTNYAGGNTSCKTFVDDPVTGRPPSCFTSKARAGTSAR